MPRASGFYDIAAVRELLLAAFTPEELRRFCQDRPTFRPIVIKFGLGQGHDVMVDQVINYCETNLLFGELLAETKQVNPRQYERIMGTSGRRRGTNLRPWDQPHAFRDRETELRDLRKYLADDRVRLIAVLGQGGMGKTALVSVALADLEPGAEPPSSDRAGQPVDAILYLSARGGLSLEQLYSDVAQRLDEPTAHRLAEQWTYGNASPASRAENLLAALQAGRYVILLDNLEDALTADGDLADEGLRLFIEGCLTRSSWVRLAITSRQQLRLPPAALSGVRTIDLVDGLPENEAVSLLRDLDPQQRLGLQQAPLTSLLQAIRRMRGVPLALELLAGLLADDPTQQVDDLLVDDKLVGEAVIHRLLDESYRRLGEDEQRALQALAVLNRPMEAEVVGFLLQPWYPGIDVRSALRHLVGRFMATVPRGGRQYSLHPLNREYAYSRLPGEGEGTSCKRRDLELRAAEYYASIRKPKSEWKTIEDLAPQLAEFEHRVRAGDFDDACRLLNPVDSEYLFKWGHHARLADMRGRLVGQLANSGLQAANLGGLGLALHALGQIRQAIDCYQQAVVLARKIGERASEGIWLGDLGSAYRDLGQAEKAIELCEQALSIAREVGDRPHEGVWLGDLGNVFHKLGQFDHAVELYEQALSIHREVGDRRREGTESAHLGHAYRALGQLEPAVELYEKALVIAREVGDRAAEGSHLGRLGTAYRQMGRVEQAIEFHEQALAIAREIGNRREEGFELGNLGRDYYYLGQIDQAVELFKQDSAINQEIGDRRSDGAILSNLGDASTMLGLLDQAMAYYEQALSRAQETSDRRGVVQQLGNLGSIYRRLGQPNRAKGLFDEALALARSIKYRRYESVLLAHLGSAHYAMGHAKEATECYEVALAIARDVGDKQGECRRLLRLARVQMQTGSLLDARERCMEAVAVRLPGTSGQAALMLGMICLLEHDAQAGQAFADAIIQSRSWLEKTEDLYETRYILATALAGQAVSDPRWANEYERISLLAAALAEYRRALSNCAAPGVVQDALRDLELIRSAGINGLEPIFDQLRAHASSEPA